MKQLQANTELQAILIQAKNLSDRLYSDVLDDQGHQYVDLVQEGGGILGLALVGYIHVLEEAGIRFRSLAGTSAGAINTIMMAGLGSIKERKSERLLKIISTQDFSQFIDGGANAKALVHLAVSKLGKSNEPTVVSGIKRIYNILAFGVRVLRARKNIFQKQGLNPGIEVYNWIKRILDNAGIHSMSDLRARMEQDLHLLRIRKERADPAAPDFSIDLSLTAADITTRSGVFFPKMAKLYFENVDAVHPAVFARASMSIPFFYEPTIIKNIPRAGTQATGAWKKEAGYFGKIPHEVKFVDGGVVSNFPLEVFHLNNKVPRLPTFGVKLGADRENIYQNDKAIDFVGSLLDTATNYSDMNFVLRNPEAYSLVQIIEVGAHNWLNFEMTDAQKTALYLSGARAALQFLNRFDWIEYREQRKIGVKQRDFAEKMRFELALLKHKNRDNR